MATLLYPDPTFMIIVLAVQKLLGWQRTLADTLYNLDFLQHFFLLKRFLQNLWFVNKDTKCHGRLVGDMFLKYILKSLYCTNEINIHFTEACFLHGKWHRQNHLLQKNSIHYGTMGRNALEVHFEYIFFCCTNLLN